MAEWARLPRGARNLERWLHAPATGTEAAMEILLIIRFCCNCTYGNPGTPQREVVCLKPPGGWLEQAEMWPAGCGGSRGGRLGKWLDLHAFFLGPVVNLELKSGGCSRQGGLDME